MSEGELVDALHRVLPVKSLDALKWRTGATMGPCHGGRCTARIVQIMQRELGVQAEAIQKRQQGSGFVAAECADALRSDDLRAIDAIAPSDVVERCSKLAFELRENLDARAMHEVGWGSLGIAGTRPSGVYSALQALELLCATERLPERKAVVWGTHDLALRVALALADAGVVMQRVLEDGEAPEGAPELVDELAARSIPVQCRARVLEVAGANRLESAVIAQDGSRETVTCDLLIASPCIIPE